MLIKRDLHPNDLPNRRTAIHMAEEEYSRVSAIYETADGKLLFEFWPGSEPDNRFYNRAGDIFGIPFEAWFWFERGTSPAKLRWDSTPKAPLNLFWGAPVEPLGPSEGLLEMFPA